MRSIAVRLQVYSQLRRLASSQKHPKDASIPMFWTVAYDWRRDFYEQVRAALPPPCR